MSYAALIRPVIDRVYIAARGSGRQYTSVVVQEMGLNPGFIASFYFGLLARSMPAASFAAATTYGGGDMTGELEQKIAYVDDTGTWHLTESGRALGIAFQRAVGQGAGEAWGEQPLPRLSELLDRVLKQGSGIAFSAMAPVYVPEDATLPTIVSSQLGALRHHRADAHRAAWQGAGLSLDEVRALPADNPQRRAIEDETNRLDAPIYAGLSDAERTELLGLLGALPG